MQVNKARNLDKSSMGRLRGIIGLTLLFMLTVMITVGCTGSQEANTPGETETALSQESMEAPEAPEEAEGEEMVSEESEPKETPEAQPVADVESQSHQGAASQEPSPSEPAPQETASQESETELEPVKEETESQSVPELTLEPGGLLITGTALEKDLVLNPTQWQLNSPDFVQRLYSSNNNLGFHKVWVVKGYDLLNLFRQAGMVEGKDHTITFVSADGLSINFSLSDLQNRFFFSDLTPGSGMKVMPVIGFFRKELFDAIEPQPPVTWQEEALSDRDADPQWPRLYLGQQPNNPSDVNQPFFIRELVRVVVGEER